MGFDLSNIATDRDKEVEGVWSQDLGEGLQLKVARANNPRYVKAVSAFTQSQRSQLGGVRTIDEEKASEQLALILADTILLDWKNLDENQQPLPYSRENAARVLRQYPELYRIVSQLSNQIELFKRSEQENIEGN